MKRKTLEDIKNALKQASTANGKSINQKPDWEIGEYPINTLQKLPYHSKIPIPGRVGKTKESLEKVGFKAPIIVNRLNNELRVVDGWLRKTLWANMGNRTIPCLIVEVDEHDERRLYVYLNTIEGDFEPEHRERLLNFYLDKHQILPKPKPAEPKTEREKDITLKLTYTPEKAKIVHENVALIAGNQKLSQSEVIFIALESYCKTIKTN